MNQTIRGARGKSIRLFITALVFLALGIWLPLDGDSKTVAVKWGAILLGGLGALISLYQIVTPATLSLDAKGFTYRGLMGRGFTVPWADVESFHLWRVPTAPMVQMLAWTYRPGRQPKSPLAGVASGMGADGAAPGGWSLKEKALLALMNERLEASRA